MPRSIVQLQDLFFTERLRRGSVAPAPSAPWTPIQSTKVIAGVDTCAFTSGSSLEVWAPPKNLGSGWSLAESAGRLVEISGAETTASLTLAFGMVLEAQRQGEPVGWVMPGESFFYPPDVAEGGVDLDALVVIRLPDVRAVPRAGDRLVRSGAFGLVVLDVGAAGIPTPLQARLVGLAQKHHTALVCLTEKASEAPSLGSLVSLRVHGQRARISEGRFTCGLRVLKDKRWGTIWTEQREVCRGPAGLR